MTLGRLRGLNQCVLVHVVKRQRTVILVPIRLRNDVCDLGRKFPIGTNGSGSALIGDLKALHAHASTCDEREVPREDRRATLLERNATIARGNVNIRLRTIMIIRAREFVLGRASIGYGTT